MDVAVCLLSRDRWHFWTHDKRLGLEHIVVKKDKTWIEWSVA